MAHKESWPITSHKCSSTDLFVNTMLCPAHGLMELNYIFPELEKQAQAVLSKPHRGAWPAAVFVSLTFGLWNKWNAAHQLIDVCCVISTGNELSVNLLCFLHPYKNPYIAHPLMRYKNTKPRRGAHTGNRIEKVTGFRILIFFWYQKTMTLCMSIMKYNN